MSAVYYYNARADQQQNLVQKTETLFEQAGFPAAIHIGDKIAIKVHFGEAGNLSHLHPRLVRTVVDQVRKRGGVPFVTDTNTIYSGARHDAVHHLQTAIENGFSAATLGAPLLISDGLLGLDYQKVEVRGGKWIQQAHIASGIFQADGLIVLSHSKLHMLFGYAGALKNLGMGCSAAPGKQILHADYRSHVIEKRCTGCGECVVHCFQKAIVLGDSKKEPGRTVAKILAEKCVGCAECVVICKHQAIPVNWKTSIPPLLEKTAEYAWAAVDNKAGKVAYLNFLLSVNPDCDCMGWNDLPIVPDIGLLASFDPVAIDCASIDLINQAPVSPGSELAEKGFSGPDKIRALKGELKGTDYRLILTHAEKLGLGSQKYQLIAAEKPHLK